MAVLFYKPGWMTSQNHSSQLTIPGDDASGCAIVNNWPASEHMSPTSPIGHPPDSPYRDGPESRFASPRMPLWTWPHWGRMRTTEAVCPWADASTLWIFAQWNVLSSMNKVNSTLVNYQWLNPNVFSEPKTRTFRDLTVNLHDFMIGCFISPKTRRI